MAPGLFDIRHLLRTDQFHYQRLTSVSQFVISEHILTRSRNIPKDSVHNTELQFPACDHISLNASNNATTRYKVQI